MPDTNPASSQLNIKASDAALQGLYATAAQIFHNRDEFVFDFFSTLPPHGQLLSRLITSPSHAKLFLQALEQNIQNYEAQHGPIAASSAEAQSQFGFKY